MEAVVAAAKGATFVDIVRAAGFKDEDIFTGDTAELEGLIEALNGLIARPLEGIKYSFVSASNMAYFPAHLVSEEWLDLSKSKVTFLRDASLGRVSKADLAKGENKWVQKLGERPIGFLPQYVPWAPYDGDVDKSLGGILPVRGTLGDWVEIAALNMAAGRSFRVAALIATAALAGAYNLGGEGEVLKREWTVVDSRPALSHFKTVIDSLKGGIITSVIQYGFQVLSSLGYLRISDTHPVLSGDPAQMKKVKDRIKICAEKIVGISDWSEATDDDVKNSFHGPMHGASLHGAVGIMMHWTKGIYCTEKIAIRDAPIGDVNKDVSIATAGYGKLCSHPIVYTAIQMYQADIEKLYATMDLVKTRPWVTSSLSYLFCGKEPVRIMKVAPSAVASLNAAIAAATAVALLGRSFENAYHIKGVITDFPGSVKFWRDFYRSIRQRVKNLNVSAFAKQIKGASKRESRAAIKAAKRGEKEEEEEEVEDEGDEEGEDEDDGEDETDNDGSDSDDVDDDGDDSEGDDVDDSGEGGGDGI